MAIDYSLLVVTRWREERAAGLRNADAVTAAMAQAGRSVVFSGLTVGIGLLSLIVLPVPMLRSVGFAGVLVSVVVALFGRFNWWLPAPLARVLRVKDGPVRPSLRVAPAGEEAREPAAVVLGSR